MKTYEISQPKIFVNKTSRAPTYAAIKIDSNIITEEYWITCARVGHLTFFISEADSLM